jgi:hypothetical protein
VRTRRTTATLVVALPVAAYLATLLLVAALYVKPPLIGWIGFGVVAALSCLLAAGAFVLFPRMRTTVDAVVAPDPTHLVVLADASCPADRLCDTIALRLAGRSPDVLVVAPVLASPLHYFAGDEERERWDAEARLGAVVASLRERGLHVEGRVGDDDPLQALGDALAGFPAGEALVVTSPGTHWLEEGLFERARRLVPVLEHVEAA